MKVPPEIQMFNKTPDADSREHVRKVTVNNKGRNNKVSKTLHMKKKSINSSIYQGGNKSTTISGQVTKYNSPRVSNVDAMNQRFQQSDYFPTFNNAEK